MKNEPQEEMMASPSHERILPETMDEWDALTDEQYVFAVRNWKTVQERASQAEMNYVLSRERPPLAALAPTEPEEEDDEDAPGSLLKLGMRLSQFFGH